MQATALSFLLVSRAMWTTITAKVVQIIVKAIPNSVHIVPARDAEAIDAYSIMSATIVTNSSRLEPTAADVNATSQWTGDTVVTIEIEFPLSGVKGIYCFQKQVCQVEDRSYFFQLSHFFRYPCLPCCHFLRHWFILCAPTHKPFTMRPSLYGQSENSV